jgi:autotransporter adhesin
LSSANRYTDQRLGAITQAFDQLQVDLWDRFDQTDTRISRTGAMNTAMSQMSAAAAAVARSNRVAVGVGFQDGYEALAVGFQREVRDNVTLTFGASISGDESTVGGGVGVGW